MSIYSSGYTELYSHPTRYSQYPSYPKYGRNLQSIIRYRPTRTYTPIPASNADVIKPSKAIRLPANTTTPLGPTLPTSLPSSKLSVRLWQGLRIALVFANASKLSAHRMFRNRIMLRKGKLLSSVPTPLYNHSSIASNNYIPTTSYRNAFRKSPETSTKNALYTR